MLSTKSVLFSTMSPLAKLYSTSTMEHHHFDHCVMILNTKVVFLYLKFTLLGFFCENCEACMGPAR